MSLENTVEALARHVQYLEERLARAEAQTALYGVFAQVACTGSVQLTEQTAPGAPAADNVVLYAVDNGAGKTQLMARFATGAAQQVAIEP